MTHDEKRAFTQAADDGRLAADRARDAVSRGEREAAEAAIMEAARECNAALQAIGSRYQVRIEEQGR
jgi:hypothetical protein